jgi:hypothetical protein
MARYIRKVTPVFPAPRPVEQTHETWVGYDLPWLSGDLSAVGLIPADGFSAQQLHDHGVIAFDVVDPGDETTLRLLGLRS